MPLVIVLMLLPWAAISAAEPPHPLVPAAGAVTYAPHPHFRWQREEDAALDDVHQIQIGRDEAFADVVCDDNVEVVSRFVPVEPLAPGTYWWRVRRGDGEWSVPTLFEARAPERAFTIPAGSDAAAVARVVREAAASGPALVNFEPGEYRLAPPDGDCLVTLANARDLVIDGHGARLVLDGTFLMLNDCQRVTLRRLTVLPARPGHTLVRVVGKDPAAGRLVVKPAPGYDADVARFFTMDRSGGSFLGCMDPDRHGAYIPGAGVSARGAGVTPQPDEAGQFVVSPVQAKTLELIPEGSLAIVTTYRWQWVRMNRTEECTFSDVTVTDLPGAFSGGSNNSARSYLACRVKPRSPQDFFGGHAATGSGRIGEWIEGCEFECLPDDGPAEQSFRQAIQREDGADAVVVAGNAVRTGDRVALVHARSHRGVAAVARNVTGGRVQFDRPLAELLAAIGHDAARGWDGVFLYRDAPSNEDFVYRRNRTSGGRAHGVKFNGTRAWIADNHFENINGNAVLAGYVSEVSGHGARDVLVTGNTIVHCGWTPIDVRSTSGLGGNIIICDNRVTGTRSAAVAIRGCDGVTVAGNEFASPAPPSDGAWIVVESSSNVVASGNRFPPDIPELKRLPERR